MKYTKSVKIEMTWHIMYTRIAWRILYSFGFRQRDRMLYVCISSFVLDYKLFVDYDCANPPVVVVCSRLSRLFALNFNWKIG